MYDTILLVAFFLHSYPRFRIQSIVSYEKNGCSLENFYWLSTCALRVWGSDMCKFHVYQNQDQQPRDCFSTKIISSTDEYYDFLFQLEERENYILFGIFTKFIQAYLYDHDFQKLPRAISRKSQVGKLYLYFQCMIFPDFSRF